MSWTVTAAISLNWKPEQELVDETNLLINQIFRRVWPIFTIYGDINLNNFLSGRTNMWLVRVRWNNLTRQKHGMIWNEMEQRSTKIGSKSPIEYCTIHTNDVINWKIMRDRYIIPPHNLRGTTIGICCGTRRMSICII